MPHAWLPTEAYTFEPNDLLISIPGTSWTILAPFLAVPLYLVLCLFLLPLFIPRRIEARLLLALHNGFLLLLSIAMFVGVTWAAGKHLFMVASLCVETFSNSFA